MENQMRIQNTGVRKRGQRSIGAKKRISHRGKREKREKN